MLAIIVVQCFRIECMMISPIRCTLLNQPTLDFSGVHLTAVFGKARLPGKEENASRTSTASAI